MNHIKRVRRTDPPRQTREQMRSASPSPSPSPRSEEKVIALEEEEEDSDDDELEGIGGIFAKHLPNRNTNAIVPSFVLDEIKVTGVDDDQLKRDLLQECKCPVCFQYMKNIFMCSRGHNFCETCANRVHTCPKCRAPGPRFSQNRVLEQIFQNYFASSIRKGQMNAIQNMNSWEELNTFIQEHVDHSFQILRQCKHTALLKAIICADLNSPKTILEMTALQKELPPTLRITHFQWFSSLVKMNWLQSMVGLLASADQKVTCAQLDPCIFIFKGSLYYCVLSDGGTVGSS